MVDTRLRQGTFAGGHSTPRAADGLWGDVEGTGRLPFGPEPEGSRLLGILSSRGGSSAKRNHAGETYYGAAGYDDVAHRTW